MKASIMNKRTLRLLVLLLGITSLSVAQDNSGAPKGMFSGLMFGDYFYNIARDTASSSLKNAALGGAKDYQAFQFRRIYFTYDYTMSDRFSTRFRLEADQVSNTSAGTIGVAVKDASLRWKDIFGGTDLYFGIMPTPEIDLMEGAWRYRSVEKVLTDLRGLESSRDFGIALKGKIDGEGMFNYTALIGNGNSNKPAVSKYKRYYLDFQIKPDKSFMVNVSGDYKSQAPVPDPVSAGATAANGLLTGTLFVGYKQAGSFNLGAEAIYQSLQNGYLESPGSALQNRNTLGFMVFGSVDLRTDVSLLGRYDYYDPNTNGNSKGDLRSYFIGGLSWRPDAMVSIIPNVQVETYQALPNGTTFDPSVTGRVTVYYMFQ